MSNELNERRVGLWLIGARGSISTCTAYGLAGLADGILDPIGMATMVPPFDRVALCPPENFVLGGWDVCRRDLGKSAGELVRERILDAELVEGAAARAARYEAAIRPGILDSADVGMADLDPEAARLGSESPRDQIEALVADLDRFQDENDLDSIVVVNVASTEAACEPREEWNDLRAFENALNDGRSQPASIIYAYAAISSGRPHVNFTPSRGASIPALRELALERGLPHCGNDGKTGETLLKTALAPMFKARALKVLAWQGYNMLGNRDGEVLNDPAHRASKLRNKDASLRTILDDDEAHTAVAIDYVPSLRDWKTAWDFIHFEGFLGARMSLQFTWAGSDSALASPLIIDLARLAEYARICGEKGEMSHTACYFKAPMGGVEHGHDFHKEFHELVRYAEKHSSAPNPKALRS